MSRQEISPEQLHQMVDVRTGTAMLAISNLRYVKVSEVPLGNLVLCGSFGRDELDLALRVEALGDHEVDKVGVLVFRAHTPWDDLAPVVYGKSGEFWCLDLGVPTFAISGVSIAAAVAKRSYDERLGMLALSDKSIRILATFGPFRHIRRWWDVSTGQCSVGAEHALFERWSIGLLDLNGKFVPQLRFPEDFRGDSPPS